MKTVLLVAKNQKTPSVDMFRHVLEKLPVRLELSDKPGRADLIVNRNFGMDYLDDDLDFLESAKLQCLNPVWAQRICRDKWLTHKWLEDNGFNTPNSYLAVDFCQEEGKWILKTLRGMQGRGVREFESTQELRRFMSESEDKRFLVQRKVRFEREIRAYHIGENIHWFEKFGGNLYQGGSGVEITKVEASLVESAKSIQLAMGMNLMATDFLFAEGKLWVVDVNCYPGVKMVEKYRDEFRVLFESLLC